VRPILLDVMLPGGFHLQFPAYGTFLVLGMLAAAWVSGRHGRALGIRRVDAFDLGLWLLAGGLLGSHLLHIALHWEDYFPGQQAFGLRQVAALWHPGLVYYGGLAGAFPFLWLWGRRRGLPLPDLLDFVAPLGALGLAITRIGCFLNGCCFGVPSSLPWAVTFPPGSLAHQRQVAAGLIATGSPALPVHPVQLYEFAAALVFFVFLWRRFPRRRYAGEVVVAFGLLYGTWRLAAELIRADASGWRPDAHGLNPYQWLSLAVIALAGLGWWVARRIARPPQVEPPA
jgi:phosphatidylglycerol:prolipoprotein diacylglycerol transferase